MYLKKHFFVYTIVILLVFFAAASHFRFMVQQDYNVAYGGYCNPYTQECFLYCNDDVCSEPFYYSIIERQAAEIFTLCGENITQCDAAYECQEGVEICSVIFCDLELDREDCESLTENDFVKDFTEYKS